ncbi:hypothetical protein F5X97DRAFT_320923 [Nemania serpens]|nr:hypothetical protein F5X97DRAFT_320923 [Nemania serpens]
MENLNTTTATPAAGHDKVAVDKTNPAHETCSCPAQANTALTTDGFKNNDVLADEEAQQQLRNEEATAAAATTTKGADGVEPVEGTGQHKKQRKESDDGAKTSGGEQSDEKVQKGGKLRSMLGRLKKGSDEGSEVQGEGEEASKGKPVQKAEADAP